MRRVRALVADAEEFHQMLSNRFDKVEVKFSGEGLCIYSYGEPVDVDELHYKLARELRLTAINSVHADNDGNVWIEY